METNEVWRNRQGVEKASVFEPKEYKGGRVKVYGCSPGCLLVSLALSVFLTLAVNGCIHLF
jgi:hypothetical protein